MLAPSLPAERVRVTTDAGVAGGTGTISNSSSAPGSRTEAPVGGVRTTGCGSSDAYAPPPDQSPPPAIGWVRVPIVWAVASAPRARGPLRKSWPSGPLREDPGGRSAPEELDG